MTQKTQKTQIIDTIIVGGGQGGLSTSYWLTQQQRPHLVLEQASQAAPVWRDGRWDSFTLVTPNWALRLPGAEYRGPQPDDFMSRDQVVAHFQQYVIQFQLPLQYNTQVTAVEAKPEGGGYLVRTAGAIFDAKNVVVATGLFQRPRRHAFANQIPPEIMQLHSGEYRNQKMLPNGAVLVVGSSQSGCQIADEICQSGRKVYLCVGSSGRVPRRYRGKDIYEWMDLLGFSDRLVDALPSPQIKFAGNPHVSGKNGGQDINLHRFARDGMILLGSLKNVQGYKVELALDLNENLALADKWEIDFLRGIDGYIETNKVNAPAEIVPELKDGFGMEPTEYLDLKTQGIGAVIWATGYSFEFKLVKLPVFDDDGYPVQKRGVTSYPGLYFVGLPWLHKQKSGLLSGVGEDSGFIASTIAARRA